MTVAVPGLWWRAEAELARLTAAIAKSPKEIKPLVRSVDAKATAEFAVVSNALDARFGPDAIARGDPAVIDCVPAAQHKRSDERRVGTECVSTCRSRWWR